MFINIHKYYNKHSEIIINLFWRSLQMFGKQGITFLIFIMCSKLLGPYDFGVYNYVLAAVLFLVMFCDFGISTATSKYVSEYNASDKSKLRAIIFNSGLLVFVVTILITVIILLIGPWYFKDKYIYVLYLLPLIFVIPMTSLYDGVYRGLKKFKELALISLIVGAFSTVFVYILITKLGLFGAFISQISFYFFLLAGLYFGYRELNFKINIKVVIDIGRYSLIYGVAIVGNYFFIKFGVLILGHYNYIEQIAVYELINRIFMILLLPFTLLGQVVAPNFVEYYLRGEYKKIYNKSIKYSVIFLICGVVLSIFLFCFLPYIFKLFFEPYYSIEYFHNIFLLCSLVFMTNVWSATFDSGILIPTGYAGLMARVYTIGAVFSVIISLCLVRYFGYIGVIVSFFICNLMFTTILRVLYLSKLFTLQDR